MYSELKVHIVLLWLITLKLHFLGLNTGVAQIGSILPDPTGPKS